MKGKPTGSLKKHLARLDVGKPPLVGVKMRCELIC